MIGLPIELLGISSSYSGISWLSQYMGSSMSLLQSRDSIMPPRAAVYLHHDHSSDDNQNQAFNIYEDDNGGRIINRNRFR